MSPSIPSQMRAWTYNRRGKPQDILTLTNLPVPSPGPGELLIRVSHVGLNAGMLIKFALFPHLTSVPSIPEIGFSGTVAGGSDGEFHDGDEVVGLQWRGTVCEYLVASKTLVAHKPRTLSMAESTCLPGCGMTAVEACDVVALKKGDEVLVAGGSGGLGSILVMYAKSVVGDGKVVATCSGSNMDMVKGLGADEVINYTKHDWGKYKANFDVVFDVVGDPELLLQCPAFLKQNGTFVSLGAMSLVGEPSWLSLLSFTISATFKKYQPTWMGGVPRKFQLFRGTGDVEALKRVVRMIDEHNGRPPLDSVWEMGDIKKAYEKLATRRARGKIVIEIVGAKE